MPHEQPRTWKLARSLAGTDGRHRLRVDLRGLRRLAAVTEMSFQYRLTGGDRLRIELVDGRGGAALIQELGGLSPDAWSEATARFALPLAASQDRFATEIRLVPTAGAKLEIDNLLHYEPGDP